MKKITMLATVALFLTSFGFAQFGNLQSGSNPQTQTFSANQYATWKGQLVTGNAVTGSQTVLIYTSGAFPGNRNAGVSPFGTLLVPIAFTGETLTPSAVACGQAVPAGFAKPAGGFMCNVTATFANVHGPNELIFSGDGGIIEAENDAFANGGGEVTVDKSTQSNIATAAPPVLPNVYFKDSSQGSVVYWRPVGGLTTLAAPATLTATTVGFAINGANATGGTYVGANTYNTCIAYVDAMGQEGPCSTAFSSLTAGTGSTNQIGFSAPAASAGAVGYTLYVSLTGGASNLQYKVPLATYSNGAQAPNGVCTLTQVEKITAACAVANTTYGQLGSTAQVSALTLNTSPIQPLTTTVSTTAIYVPNAGGRTTYAYIPGSGVGLQGVPSAFLPFAISAADATVVPSVLGTVNIPANFMNVLGRTLEVCGYATTSASTGTIQDIQFQWDAIGQNTAGKGVQIGDLTVTKTATSVLQLTFCEDFQTTVTGATATAGSIQNSGGYITSSIASLSAAAAGGNTQAGATASLNLANEARLNVVYVHTTGTDGTALTLQSLTVKVIN